MNDSEMRRQLASHRAANKAHGTPKGFEPEGGYQYGGSAHHLGQNNEAEGVDESPGEAKPAQRVYKAGTNKPVPDPYKDAELPYIPPPNPGAGGYKSRPLGGEHSPSNPPGGAR